MLCGACEEHFHHDMDWAVGYLRLKSKAVSLARDELDDESQLKSLELDLKIYERAVHLNRDTEGLAPCPWFRGDLSSMTWTPQIDDDCSKRIWDTPREGRDVIAFAAQGCEICQRLVAVVSHMPDFGHISTVRFESWIQFHPVSLRPIYIQFLAQRPFHHEMLYLQVIQGASTNFSGLMFEQPKGSSSDNEHCLEFLSRSLKHCMQNHESCRTSNPDNWIPTRLLDVRRTGDSSDLVYLVERSFVREESGADYVPYITLSHVWGDEDFFTLTQATLQNMEKGIALHELPQCFQDTIKMARYLDVRYIWIDSLCIIQDSPDDWTAESGTMDRVYQSGLCNFASSGSTNPREGLFCQRDSCVGSPFSLDWPWLDHIEKVDLAFDWFSTMNNHSPLYRRGWVVQERLLSPRTMHFFTFPFWECHSTVTCEMYPSESYGDHYDWIPYPEKTIMKNDESTYDSWLRIVEHYSSCELTHFHDKLVALSGIAKLFAEKLKSRYLAGLWESHIIEGLLWQVRRHFAGKDMEVERPVGCKTPSWSWASLNGPILTRSNDMSEYLARIVSVRMSPATATTFGVSSGGTLQIYGVLFEVPTPWALFDPQSHPSSSRIDGWALSFDDLSNIDHRLPETAFFLPLIRSPNASEAFNLTICGIILELVSSSSYRRIGFAIVDEDDGQIANAGWNLKSWISPDHWSNDMRTVIEIG